MQAPPGGVSINSTGFCRHSGDDPAVDRDIHYCEKLSLSLDEPGSKPAHFGRWQYEIGKSEQRAAIVFRVRPTDIGTDVSEPIRIGQIGHGHSQTHESPRRSAGLGKRSSESLRLASDSRPTPRGVVESTEAKKPRQQCRGGALRSANQRYRRSRSGVVEWAWRGARRREIVPILGALGRTRRMPGCWRSRATEAWSPAGSAS